MTSELATIEALWRYPFKSMLGEHLAASSVTERGFKHDRSYALRERATHKLATARQYQQLLEHRAVVVGDNDEAQVEIVFPDGSRLKVEQNEQLIGEKFSHLFSRIVDLERAWDERTPRGLFDDSHIHIVSLHTLEFLKRQNPPSIFDPRRFRANIVVRTDSSEERPEQSWIGKRIKIGNEVVVSVEKPCERCVMTTMPQEDLPRDNDILKTVVHEAASIVGVYARVETGGQVLIGDTLTLVD